MAEIIIVGIGNPYRGDDAAGWIVIDRLKEALGLAVHFVKLRGDIAELIDIFTKYKTVYIVDAISSKLPVGSWQRIDLHKQPIKDDNPQTSTHGFSISQAISLAQNLDSMPNQLILYGISGVNYNVVESLTPSVAKGIEGVVQAILKEEDIQSCTNTA